MVAAQLPPSAPRIPSLSVSRSAHASRPGRLGTVPRSPWYS